MCVWSRNPEREAKCPSWIISACEWMMMMMVVVVTVFLTLGMQSCVWKTYFKIFATNCDMKNYVMNFQDPTYFKPWMKLRIWVAILSFKIGILFGGGDFTQVKFHRLVLKHMRNCFYISAWSLLLKVWNYCQYFKSRYWQLFSSMRCSRISVQTLQSNETIVTCFFF
jgi:hypothetical protein